MRSGLTAIGNSFTKSHLWVVELELVRGFHDKLGMRVDAEIEDMVVALRLLGYETVMSCAGHVERRTTGPYVMFESGAAQAREPRVERIEGQDQVRNELALMQRAAQFKAEPLKRLIDDFSRSRSGRQPRLELRPVGHNGFCLCFVHADFDGILDREHYERVLGKRQSEIAYFTKYIADILNKSSMKR